MPLFHTLPRARGLRREAHPLTWPSPRTIQVVLVSSRRAMGPRACNFCVEIPISAPKPNSPPSLKRVEALTMMKAESSPAMNARSLSIEAVRIDSVCPLV